MVRISLWDEEEYKRNPKQKNCMIYCDDAPNGGCVVICGFCKKEFNEAGKEVCPFCGKDLIYPRCDW